MYTYTKGAKNPIERLCCDLGTRAAQCVYMAQLILIKVFMEKVDHNLSLEGWIWWAKSSKGNL